MARPKGSTNIAPVTARFVARIERMLAKAGYPGGLESQACRMLTGKDFKVAAFVWAKLLSYKYGLPKQTLQVAGKVEHTMTPAEREAERKVIQKPLPPAEQTLDVGGKEIRGS